MELKSLFAQDNFGNIISGAQCYVYQTGTTDKVSIYDSLGGVKSNPFLSESNGLVQFSAANGVYDLKVIAGEKNYTMRIQCNDVADSADDIVENALNSINLIFAERYQTLAEADAAAVAAGKTLVISTQWNTVPATLSANVRMETGGKLNNSSAVTFAGAFEADSSAHFIGSGSVLGLVDVIPEWFGAVGGATDDSIAIGKAFTAVKTNGGAIHFKKQEYSFYLDISGTNAQVDVYGGGNTVFRPVASRATSAVIRANNSTGFGTGSGTNVTWHGIRFSGRLHGATDTGAVDNVVMFASAWGKFYDCIFEYGRVAGFHGTFSQYQEFYSCEFSANTYNGSSLGCLLESNSVNESANENTFIRPRFNSNSNGLKITGGIANRIVGPHFQNHTNTGVGALIFDQDETGYGGNLNHVTGAYFEANSVADIVLGVSVSPLFEGNSFVGPCHITTSHCYDLKFIGNMTYGGPITTSIGHPSGASDTAALTWIGNNFDADTSAITHAGETKINYEDAATGVKKSNGMLLYDNKFLYDLVPQVSGDQYGFKNDIMREVTTSLFSLTLESNVSASAYRTQLIELTLNAYTDTTDTGVHGYAGRIQVVPILIECNSNSGPTVHVGTATSGQDMGINTEFIAIGNITITASVSGQVITFSANYSGAGSSPTIADKITIGYNVKSMGANPFTLRRL